MAPDTDTHVFQVSGMTCGHCAQAVTDELMQVPGVTDVAVSLGEPSAVTVTSTAALGDAQVAAALEEAGGYRLVPS